MNTNFYICLFFVTYLSTNCLHFAKLQIVQKNLTNIQVNYGHWLSKILLLSYSIYSIIAVLFAKSKILNPKNIKIILNRHSQGED